MSDLISKRSLLAYLQNWQHEQFAGIGYEKEYNLLEKLIHGIENEPTVSEKEIRNKAIDTFMIAIETLVKLHGSVVLSEIQDVAEQLKNGRVADER